MGKVVTVAAGKGGVGKTTTSVGLAAAWTELGLRVLLVDTDPQAAGSAAWWSERSEEGLGFTVAKELRPALLARVVEVADFDLVVIDCPPRLDSVGFAQVVDVADLVVCPSGPSPMDLASAMETVRTVVAPRDVLYRMLLVRVDPRSASTALRAQNSLVAAGIPTCGTFVREYAIYGEAVAGGTSVGKVHGRYAKEAAGDHARVAAELGGLLELAPTHSRLRKVSS